MPANAYSRQKKHRPFRLGEVKSQNLGETDSWSWGF